MINQTHITSEKGIFTPKFKAPKYLIMWQRTSQITYGRKLVSILAKEFPPQRPMKVSVWHNEFS